MDREGARRKERASRTHAPRNAGEPMQSQKGPGFRVGLSANPCARSAVLASSALELGSGAQPGLQLGTALLRIGPSELHLVHKVAFALPRLAPLGSLGPMPLGQCPLANAPWPCDGQRCATCPRHSCVRKVAGVQPSKAAIRWLVRLAVAQRFVELFHRFHRFHRFHCSHGLRRRSQRSRRLGRIHCVQKLPVAELLPSITWITCTRPCSGVSRGVSHLSIYDSPLPHERPPSHHLSGPFRLSVRFRSSRS